MIEFTVEATGIDAMFEEKRQAIINSLKRQLSVIDKQLVSRVQAKLSGNPIKSHTGLLYNSVRELPVEQNGPYITGTVEAGGGAVSVKSGGKNVSYAKFLEYGTAPHIIRPVNAKVLAFQIGGNTIFRKRVQHPGTPAYRFMGGTLDENTQAIVDQLKAAVQQGSR